MKMRPDIDDVVVCAGIALIGWGAWYEYGYGITSITIGAIISTFALVRLLR